MREVRRHFLLDKDFYISIDDTGYNKLSWAAIEVGILGDGMERLPLHIERIKSTDANSIVDRVQMAIQDYIANGAKERFKLLVTDSAKPMIAAGKRLKDVYPNLIHIFCMAHKFNRIAVTIKDQHKELFKFTGLLKQILARSHARNQLLWKFTKGLPLFYYLKLFLLSFFGLKISDFLFHMISVLDHGFGQ